MLIDQYKVPAGERGTSKKNGTGYLTLLQSKTMSRSHPRTRGVQMQAHHAISQKGMELSDYDSKFADFGYDINLEGNLVFIPSTLQGACLLNVQPHRGDHTAPSVDAPDDDRKRESSYHTKVATMLRETYGQISEICGSDMSKVKRETKQALDKLSGKIIGRIQNTPDKLRLTKISEHFGPGQQARLRGYDFR